MKTGEHRPLTVDELYATGLGEGTAFFVRELCVQLRAHTEVMQDIRDKLGRIATCISNLRIED